MFNISRIFSKLQRKPSASAAGRHASAENEQPANPETAARQATALIEAGKRAFAAERFEEAVRSFEKAMDYADAGLSVEGQAQLWFDSGLAYHRWGNLVKAYTCYEFAIQTYEENNIKADYSYCLGNSALLGVRVDFQKSVEQMEKASAMGREFGDFQSAVYHIGRLGNIFEENEEPVKAIGCYERAATLSADSGDKSGQMMSLGSLGNMYSRLGDSTKALGYFAQTLAISREIGNRAIEMDTLRKLGIGHLERAEFGESANYYEQALSLARESNHQGIEVELLVNLGGSYAGLDQPRKAIDFYTDALKILPSNQKRSADAIRGAIGELRAKYPDVV